VKIWSNNGSQHLSALTKDEVTAPHVNLVPSDLPGDLYNYVATHVWRRVEEDKKALSRDSVLACELFIDELVAQKNKIADAASRSELRTALVAVYQKYKKDNEKSLDLAAPIFWSRMVDKKQKRKVVKR